MTNFVFTNAQTLEVKAVKPLIDELILTARPLLRQTLQ